MSSPASLTTTTSSPRTPLCATSRPFRPSSSIPYRLHRQTEPFQFFLLQHVTMPRNERPASSRTCRQNPRAASENRLSETLIPGHRSPDFFDTLPPSPSCPSPVARDGQFPRHARLPMQRDRFISDDQIFGWSRDHRAGDQLVRQQTPKNASPRRTLPNPHDPLPSRSVAGQESLLLRPSRGLVHPHHRDQPARAQSKKNALKPAGAGGRHCPCRNAV